jgi:hypothetical protein
MRGLALPHGHRLKRVCSWSLQCSWLGSDTGTQRVTDLAQYFGYAALRPGCVSQMSAAIAASRNDAPIHTAGGATPSLFAAHYHLLTVVFCPFAACLEGTSCVGDRRRYYTR